MVQRPRNHKSTSKQSPESAAYFLGAFFRPFIDPVTPLEQDENETHVAWRT